MYEIPGDGVLLEQENRRLRGDIEVLDAEVDRLRTELAEASRRRTGWKYRAVVAEAALADAREEYAAWNLEGLGTCLGIEWTNYPDAWVGVGRALAQSPSLRVV